MSVDAGWPCLWLLAFCAGCWHAIQYGTKKKSLVCFFRVPVNKELLTGTVPVNKELLTNTVPVNKELLTLSVPVNKELLTGTVPVNNIYPPKIVRKLFLFSNLITMGRGVIYTPHKFYYHNFSIDLFILITRSQCYMLLMFVIFDLFAC